MLSTRTRLLATLALLSALGVAASQAGCRGRSAAARRDADRATAEAETRAQEATITRAQLTAHGTTDDDEMSAAFYLEQSDYRSRLQVALDQLDRAIGHHRSRDLRARRRLLKGDLEAVERSTQQDWATLRTKLERDLAP
jgi:C4-dicarboxylate-specific signal transduction histidine kinase